MVKNMKDFSLSTDSCRQLLALARKSMEKYLKNKEVIDFSADKNSELMSFAAVFVTLTKKGALRGCVGITEPQYPLCEATVRMSLAAALNDSRFFPLTLDELPETEIEISVLSPFKKIENAGDIIPGKHGVFVHKDGKSGLFLPQVWQHFKGKNAKTDFLNELCLQKAGLPENAWKDGFAEIFTFTVFSFKEDGKI